MCAMRVKFRFLLVLSYLLYLPLIPLLPLILMQGKKVKANTVRLPEASGKTCAEGTNEGLHLLHIGESTVAGVGVNDLGQGLTAAIFRHSPWLRGWQCIGRNGWKAGDFLQSAALPDAPLPPDTLLIITLGVNDTTGFTSIPHWQNNLQQLVQSVPPVHRVFFTQVPAMHQFPALPAPLCWFLGLRARQLDLALRILCTENGWQYLPSALTIPPGWMAADGYHPNADGYDQWGQQTAATIGHMLR